MKETASRKNIIRQGKDIRQISNVGLKSSMTLSKKGQNKESFLPRGAHKYADLPSLRYGITPTQTAFYARKSGPLRLSFGCENTYSNTKAVNGDCSIASGEHKETSCKENQNVGQTGRRVHFAELPPKYDCFTDFRNFNNRRKDRSEGKEETENSMRNRIGISCTDGDGNSVSSSQLARHSIHSSSGNFSSFTGKFEESKLGNNGEPGGKKTSHVNSPLKDWLRGHNSGKHRRGTLNQVPISHHQLPAILKAAKDGDDDEVAEILRKSTLFGISPEELNATDGSGRIKASNLIKNSTLTFIDVQQSWDESDEAHDFLKVNILNRITPHHGKLIFLTHKDFLDIQTALSYIASNGTLKNLKSILKLPNIDVNKSDNEGNTPLHFSAQAGQVEAINYMLSICPNVEIDARNALGFTPLMKAALQGRTKCAKLLLFTGASPNLRDSGRGLKAEQWAKFCGRYSCAEVIEKFARQKLTEKSTPMGKWGSEPELVRDNTPKPPQIVPSSTSSNIKLKLRKAFRTTSHPGPENTVKPFSVISQLSTVALCASSPVLQSNVSPSIKSLIRPLSVPKLEVTLATNYTTSDDTTFALQHSSSDKSIKEKSNSSILLCRRKKKK